MQRDQRVCSLVEVAERCLRHWSAKPGRDACKQKEAHRLVQHRIITLLLLIENALSLVPITRYFTAA